MGTGGAIDCGTGSPWILGCTFINNSAKHGGAAATSGLSRIENCLFMENEANIVFGFGGGGGVAVWASSASIVNCIFHKNRSNDMGGGVFIELESSAEIINCTMSDNKAPNGSCLGLLGAKSITVANTIMAFGSVGSAVIGSGNITVSSSNVFGNAGGDWTGPIAGQLGINGNISEDPLFVNRQIGDFHLRYESPCRDSGDGSAPKVPPSDFEGDPRIAYGTADMGADEFYTHLYWTGDATSSGNVALKFVGLPGTTPVQLWLGSGVLNPPMSTKYGDWYLELPLLFSATLGSIPNPDGILVLPITLPAGIPTPLILPLQAGIGQELTNLSVMPVE